MLGHRPLERARIDDAFFAQRQQIRQQLSRHRGPEYRALRTIDGDHELRNRHRLARKHLEQLGLAQLSMLDVLIDFGARVLHDRSVSAVDARRVREFVAQPQQRALIWTHRAAGRCDDNRAFSQDHVTGKKRAFAGLVKCHVLEGVPGRIDHAQCKRTHP